MELRVLRYFLAVAREQSISGAAASLNVTQPTLSRQIIELEEELGTKLFIRGNRRITLTDEGMLFRKRAGEIVDLVQRTESEMLAPLADVSGDVYIGGGETHAVHLITKIIKEIQDEYPAVNFHFYSGNADDVTERLDKGLLDFGIVIQPADVTKYDSIRLPAKDTWGLLMRKDSPLASRKSITPEDLVGLPLIISRQSLVNTGIAAWFKGDYEKLNIVATYNLIYNASLMVEDGIGYAFSLGGLINTTGDSNLCFIPLEPLFQAGLDIVWKKYQVFSKPAKLFLERMQDRFDSTQNRSSR